MLANFRWYGGGKHPAAAAARTRRRGIAHLAKSRESASRLPLLL
jgi:hypothetical protein